MKKRTRNTRRAFTLVELVVAGMAAMLVIGAVTISLFQSARARTASKTRLVAYSRANAAMDIIRREVASVMRRSDLFETRLLIYDDSVMNEYGELDRDEMLIFNTNLRPTRPNEYAGEGQEYESQFRIGEDQAAIALWQRRDAVPDQWSDAGGLALPVTLGIVGLKIEAYDGEAWFDEWDSDIDGLPWAVRITLTAEGQDSDDNGSSRDSHLAKLRTQIAIDRIIPPPPPEPEEGEETGEEGGEETLEDEGSSVGSGAGSGSGRAPGGGGGRRPGGMGRPGSGGGRPSGNGVPGRPNSGPGRGYGGGNRGDSPGNYGNGGGPR